MKNGALLVQHLFEIVESHQSKEMRLLGCICLTNLCRAKAISDEDPNVSKILVSALALLLDEPGIIRCRAPIVLAYLVSHNEALQLSTIGCNAIGRLAKMLKSATELEQKAIQEYGSLKHDSTLPQYREGALLALAAICSTKDECRKLVSRVRLVVNFFLLFF